ncbi:MAG: hypothetical protein AABY22_09510 [Nanoarchaeota archaeon]
MNKKIGLILNNVGASDLNLHLLSCLTRILEKKSGISPIIFYQTPNKPLTVYACAIFSISEAYSYNGTLIATQLDQGKLLGEIFGPTRKILYLHNLDFISYTNFPWESLNLIFGNKEIEIWTRSQLYADILVNNFNVKVHITEFNKLLEDILENKPNNKLESNNASSV